MTKRLALVTGGGSGIGRAIARRTAAVAELGADACFEPMDVTDGESIAHIEGSLRSVDILVNVAGGDDVRPFLETDEAMWRQLVDLNLMSVLRASRAVLPAMVKRKFGRIVNISSEAGRVGSAGQAAYSGAKGGVIALGRSIAREVAQSGVTVNTVCPGPTATPPLAKTVADGGANYIAALQRLIPIGRLGQPEDVAAAVSLFASDEAQFITGQTLSVSGGMTMV